MYCPECGTQNDPNAYRCVQCGAVLPRNNAPAQQAHAPGSVPNYLVQSILVTVCCCLPFGIAAIVFSAQVNGKLAAGDYEGAVEASNKAKMWCWIAFGVGLVVQMIYGAFTGMSIIGALSGNGTTGFE